MIHRGTIDETMISEYMRERCLARDTKFPQETLIQTYHAEGILIYSETARFYLEQARLNYFSHWISFDCMINSTVG